MRDFSEITSNYRIRVGVAATDGFNGDITLPHWTGSIVCSTGAGWEHVSVAPYRKNITPSWDDMCMIKDIFFKDDEAVIQIHPPRAEYVNLKENCLHLWRCTYKKMVLPPAILVGIRKGQSLKDIQKEIDEAYRIAEEGK